MKRSDKVVNLTDGEYCKVGTVVKGVFYVIVIYAERWSHCG
jgi:hypothetical protein